ncbi:hypothetical protein H5410_013196 [Solanum commersonii]|uniref:Uncharacterized protein n=1 Tax=Solanum commersonii TaxID=4109 RepID=A0A9J6AUS0_SOLCO|nr:hypothetical protein H5410_013196 [Solanum commersonii]
MEITKNISIFKASCQVKPEGLVASIMITALIHEDLILKGYFRSQSRLQLKYCIICFRNGRQGGPIFYYGGKWVLTPTVIYIKKLTHVWKEYDPDLLSYIDICEEDSGIRTIQTTLSIKSSLVYLNCLREEENDENKPYVVTVDAATEGESSKEENDENEPYLSDYNNEELESFRLEKKREVNDQLDNFKKLKKGMSFKNLDEAKRLQGNDLKLRPCKLEHITSRRGSKMILSAN